jgi:hypothetical protein
MEFCLECREFVKKKEFVRHVKDVHGYRTKKQYLEKWQGENMEDVKTTVKEIETEEINTKKELSDEEFQTYFKLNNDLNQLRMELGRTQQIITALAQQTNEIERQFVDHKRNVSQRLELTNLNWRVDPQTKEIVE